MTAKPLREPENLKAAVMNAALDAIVISRDDGRVVECNPAAERLFGLTAEQVLGKSMGDLIAASPALDMTNPCGANGLGAFGPRVHLDGIKSDGTLFPAELSLRPVSVEGHMLHVAYIRDLSAEREAFTAIEAQRQRLTQFEKLSAMSSLLAGVAHELNNPLAILVAQSTLLREKAPTADIERRAERIHAAALRAGRIVKSFLAMAQHKAPVLEPLDLNGVLDDTLQFLGYGLRSADIEVVRHLDPALPSVNADRDLMGQVFASLLINAQQALAGREEGRLIEIRSFTDEDAVVFDVEDNGSGVAPEIADRIFDPYFTTRAVGSATGVGLSLCRSVLASHGGSIALRQRASGGAQFRLSLPSYTTVAGGSSPDRSIPRAGMSILVVDDERDVAESLGELIELFGHRVRVETSAADALRRIDGQAFDMVFSDYHMPGLDGLAFRRAIGLRNAALAARTVLMTGDTVSRSRHDDFRGEAKGLILEKPFTASDVRALLDQVDPHK